MTRERRMVLFFLVYFFMVLIVIGLFSISTQSATNGQSADCREMKKDIAEMKGDLKDYKKDYKKGGPIDSEDKTDFTKEASDVKKDFNEYLADPQSDPEEKAKAEEGLKLVSQMEDGIAKNNINMVLSNYAKIIELYEWFYQNEGCQ
jgi:hypothetical protein